VPWKTKTPVDMRMEFIQRLAKDERLTDLCREYGISRKTAYKFKERFERRGAAGLQDGSRAPHVIPHKTAPELEALIVAERRRHPTWGPRKLKSLLEKRFGRAFPSPATIGNIVQRHGLAQPRKKRVRYERPEAFAVLGEALKPNDVWCIDYKGQFRLGDATYCYPLTLTDQYSRFILGCEGMAAISDEAARDVCEEAFSTHGLPLVIRSDNGAPFASRGLAGLTKLSVFWLRLGIGLERTRPGHPQDNGRHERMHRTLKFETARPARANLLQQQERFDAFVEEFNTERPHEALDMKRPADLYRRSPRSAPSRLPDLRYPAHDDVVRVNAYGQIYIAGLGQAPLSVALAGNDVGIREERDGRWLVTFADLDLGHIGKDKRITPIDNAPPERLVRCNPCA
jgi:transposase InsO family protein